MAVVKSLRRTHSVSAAAAGYTHKMGGEGPSLANTIQGLSKSRNCIFVTTNSPRPTREQIMA